jgi:hypothetical protein
MANTPKLFTLLDLCIIAACGAGAVFFFPFVQSHSPATIAVFRDNAKVAQYPLSQDRTFTVRGNGGAMTVSVENGGVRVLSSSCPKKICMLAGTIRHGGQQIVCVPNHVLIELETAPKGAVDAVTR